MNQQIIAVFQQEKSGEKKIRAIQQLGGDHFRIKIITLAGPFPPIIDDASSYLPEKIEADLVLDFLTHPDLSYDLGLLCSRLGIPAIASGKKHRIPGVITPPT